MKKSVMIMDDDVDIRSTISDILEDLGYAVTSAGDGKEGIDILKSMNTAPGLIILDFMMPNMNGSDFLKVRSESHTLSNIPVAYFSADSDIHARSKAAGVESLRKPVDYKELMSMVQKYCD